MSCWVVPNVAADLWGMSLADVMAAVHDGRATLKRDEGFDLIDVAPHGKEICRPDGCKHTQRPAMHRLVSKMEIDELLAPLGAESERPDETFNWRRARSETSFKRKAPGTFALLRAA